MQLTPNQIPAPSAENNDSSMDSNPDPLTLSSGSADPEETIWINGSRERTGLPSDDVDEMSSRPDYPLPSNSSSTISSEAAKLLRQTIGRPIAALLSYQDRFSASSPRGEAHYSRSFKLIITKYSLLTLLISLLIAGALHLAPTLSGDPDAEFFIDFSTMLEVQGRMANTFVGGKTAGIELAKKLTRTELATSDLIALVRHSGLPSSDILAKELVAFVKHASDTADLLLTLDAKAMGTVESLIYIDEHMFKAIEKASQYNPGLTALIPFVQKKNPMDIVNRNFIELMSIEEKALSDLIRLATDAYARLVLVKEHFQGIRDLARLENITVADDLEEVLSSIWTFFGFNKAEIRTFQRNLELLKSLDGYTEDAKAHVAQALFNLKALQSQLKGLRDKTAQPTIVGNAVPIDVHVKILDEGLRRVRGLIKGGERL